MEICIRRITPDDRGEWFKMRKGIWPEAPDEYLDFDMTDILASNEDAVFFALLEDRPVGMVEARLRDYGEGWKPAGCFWQVRTLHMRLEKGRQ